ncbi:MAG TPA: sulfite exporter TauE/SafE family protein [Solirubrobacteraceae bacterium]|nr:sulfite exporter TauE/SafE family protein [Solirubrobacteraceae bacterium]
MACSVAESHHASELSARTLKLAAIGTAAGLFSGLFGVGGGSVIVPLLVLWLGYGEREATGTSLAAIVFIAAVAAAVQAAYGNVRVLDAALIGVPAVGGVLLGTWLQQRAHVQVIALLFAAVLVASAVELVLQ